MNIAPGSVTSMTPAPEGVWNVAFKAAGSDTQWATCPVIGWAVVVTSVNEDGAAHTEVKPAFLWGDMVWTEYDLREHAPDFQGLYVQRASGLAIDATDFTKRSKSQTAKLDGRLVPVPPAGR